MAIETDQSVELMVEKLIQTPINGKSVTEMSIDTNYDHVSYGDITSFGTCQIFQCTIILIMLCQLY